MLVVTTGDLEEVALELIAKGVTNDLIEEKPISPIVLIIRNVCRMFVCSWVKKIVRIVWMCILSALLKNSGIADFGAHALLHEGAELALIVNLDDLLRPIGRVGNVELHLDGECAVKTVARKLSTGEVEGFGRVDFWSSKGLV